jgi:mannitol 2-dehydrogenase
VLVPLERSQRENPTAFIENRAVFGDLATRDGFVEPYRWTLESLHRHGARRTMEALMRER